GKTSIPGFYGSPDKQTTLPAEASKDGYKTARIGVPLTQKQVGKTIAGGTIKLQREVTNGIKVTVTVLDKNDHHGIGEANVVLDGPGYYPGSTNGSGEAAFYVAETGAFNVRISQDTYRPFSAQMTVLKDEKDKGKVVTYELEPKANKDEGRDIIEVTVLKKDPTDEKSK